MSKKLTKTFAKNRRADFDYEIENLYIAGLVLSGQEVKSVRQGNVSLSNAFADFINGELWAKNIFINKYSHASLDNYNPLRPRKLLLHKNELAKLLASKQSGRHIVVKEIGAQGKYIKLLIATGRSKKKYDKRETIRKRSAELEAKKRIKKSQFR